MSEPGKAADPVPKAADDFVTKYKVRHLTLGIRAHLAVEDVEKLLTSLLNRLGLFAPSLCFDHLRGV